MAFHSTLWLAFLFPSPLPTTKSYSVVLQPCLFAAATANKQPLLWTSLFEEEYKSQINQNFGRGLIYIFEVGMKTFFLIWEFSMSKSQLKKNLKNSLIFLKLEAEFFLSPCCHAIHLQQICWFKIFSRMYGLIVMLTITTSKVHLPIPFFL